MKYYSDITNQLYETREQLFKAERDYKTELIAKARADEKAKKIADLEAHKTSETIKEMIDRFKFKYPSFEFADAEDDKVEKTAPAKTNGACGNCNKCVKTNTEDKKKKEMTDSGYYSSAYVNLNGKEFYAEGADSWNDVKKAVREYFEKLQGLK